MSVLQIGKYICTSTTGPTYYYDIIGIEGFIKYRIFKPHRGYWSGYRISRTSESEGFYNMINDGRLKMMTKQDIIKFTLKYRV